MWVRTSRAPFGLFRPPRETMSTLHGDGGAAMRRPLESTTQGPRPERTFRRFLRGNVPPRESNLITNPGTTGVRTPVTSYRSGLELHDTCQPIVSANTLKEVIRTLY